MNRKELTLAGTLILVSAAVALPVASFAQAEGEADAMRAEMHGTFVGEMRDDMFGGPDGSMGLRGIEFATLDADADGNVTEAEIRAYRQGQIAGLDANTDGLISADEMTAHMLKGAEAKIAEMVQRRIANRDIDGDGQLSAAEMIAPPMPVQMLQGMDANGDGAISRAEYDTAAEGLRARMEERRAARGNQGDEGHGRGHDDRGDRRGGRRGGQGN